MKKRVINWKILIICLIIVFGTAFIGSLFTSPVTNSEWYVQNRPAITPPNYVFPIVWNILFFLIALSLYFAWTNANKNQKKIVAFVFGLNLILNALWSYLFFGLQNPLLAFTELIMLGGSIILIMAHVYEINKTSTWLLLPYLLWVGFAGVLNWLWIV